MNKLNCIAVDDEPLALSLVGAFIQQTPFLHLVGKYSSAIAALKVIHEQAVDLVFLDIQMPDLTGMELARVLGSGQSSNGPRIIFTTAFSQFALEGYRVDALDYLLKPFNYEEFLRAANKARAHLERGQNIVPAPAAVVPETPEAEYLFLKVEYQLLRIAFDDILYIEGLKDYVKVHLQSATKPILSLISLKALEEKLPAHKFMRIHRSFIVSLAKIKAVTRNQVQINEVHITVSDQYKENFNLFLNRWT